MSAETYVDSRADMARPGDLPEPVREAREAALGMAGFGLAYPVVLGLILGDEAAMTAALQFCGSWLLGLAVLAFAGRGHSVRRAAIALAVVQVVMVLRVHVANVPGPVAVIAMLYVCGISVAVVYLLRRRAAVVWFGTR